MIIHVFLNWGFVIVLHKLKTYKITELYIPYEKIQILMTLRVSHKNTIAFAKPNIVSRLCFIVSHARVDPSTSYHRLTWNHRRREISFFRRDRECVSCAVQRKKKKRYALLLFSGAAAR